MLAYGKKMDSHAGTWETEKINVTLTLIIMNMNDKKIYIGKLAEFLHNQGMVMSGEELAEHINRNKFLTSYGTKYQGGRGTYTLIRETWKWLHDDLELNKEADHVASAFVKPNGSYAYK